MIVIIIGNVSISEHPHSMTRGMESDEHSEVIKVQFEVKVRSVPEKWSIWPQHDKSIF